MGTEQSAEMQLRKMRHALGLDRARPAYRNHYVSFGDDADLEAAVRSGLMIRQSGTGAGVLYKVTRKGLRALGLTLDDCEAGLFRAGESCPRPAFEGEVCAELYGDGA